MNTVNQGSVRSDLVVIVMKQKMAGLGNRSCKQHSYYAGNNEELILRWHEKAQNKLVNISHNSL